MKRNKKIIVSFFQSKNGIIGILNNKKIVIHYDSKNKVKNNETWLCNIINVKKYMIIVEPIKKITSEDVLGNERLILTKDNSFILIDDNNTKKIIDNVEDLRRELKSEVIGFICRK